jgi:hypothetical protein
MTKKEVWRMAEETIKTTKIPAEKQAEFIKRFAEEQWQKICERKIRDREQAKTIKRLAKETTEKIYAKRGEVIRK